MSVYAQSMNIRFVFYTSSYRIKLFFIRISFIRTHNKRLVFMGLLRIDWQGFKRLFIPPRIKPYHILFIKNVPLENIQWTF